LNSSGNFNGLSIKDVFLQNDDSLKFLRDLGLRKPDEVDLWNNENNKISDRNNIIKFEEFLAKYEKLRKKAVNKKGESDNLHYDNYKDYINRLSDTPFIPSINNITKEHVLKKPTEVYIRNEDLNLYFNNFAVFFVSEELFGKFGSDRLGLFLEEIGTRDLPRRIRVEGNLSEKAKKELREQEDYYDYAKDEITHDYKYEGLENFLKNITQEGSLLLWRLILKTVEELGIAQERKDNESEHYNDQEYIYDLDKYSFRGRITKKYDLQEEYEVGLGSIDESYMDNFFHGFYLWLPKNKRTWYSYNLFKADFVRVLEKEPWLVDKNNDFKEPSEVSLADLIDDYKNCAEGKYWILDLIAENLGFKKGINSSIGLNYYKESARNLKSFENIKQLYANKKGLSPNDVSNERIEEFIKEALERDLKENMPQKIKNSRWAPDCKPEESNYDFLELEPEKIIIRDLNGQENKENGSNKKVKFENEEEYEEKSELLGYTDKKNIGRWGEEYIYYFFKNHRFKNEGIIEDGKGFKISGNKNDGIEVIWLNKNPDNVGIGYDFIIKKNNNDIEFIEVKSKIQGPEHKTVIKISGIQWGFARELYDNGEGDKYFIYIVYNVGKLNPYIKILKNPIKLWINGRIHADPINIKV
jgi:hypothetical protein